jgi:hypothetical protein
MSQDNVLTVQAVDEEPLAEHATQRSRHHYAKLVDRYFEYAHSNRLEEVVAMFTDDAFATFVVAPEPFSGKEAIRGFYTQLFPGLPAHRARDLLGHHRGQPRDHRAEDDHRQARRHPRGPALQHQSLHLRGRSHQDPARDGQPRLIIRLNKRGAPPPRECPRGSRGGGVVAVYVSTGSRRSGFRRCTST